MLRYGITPDVVTHIVLYRIWQNLMVAKEHSTIEDFLQFEDYGSVFSLKKFVVSLLRIALLGDFGREVDSSSERLHLLIERMEMSDGFVSP